jgi:hypothetical protein
MARRSGHFARNPLFSLVIITVMATLLLFCARDKSPLEPEINLVRAAVPLTADDIPALKGQELAADDEKPQLWESGLQEGERNYVVKFPYGWVAKADDWLYVDLTVTDSKEMAHQYLMQMRMTCSLPMDLYAPEDHPPVAGHISYSSRVNSSISFIRDNIIIEIRAHGRFEGMNIDIAKQIDACLLKSATAATADRMRPVIAKFAIAQNPVKYNSMTPLIINVRDPMKGKLYYAWRFSPTSEDRGGIEVDEFGDYFYYAETYSPTEELTMIVMNDCGFYASATIYISITQRGQTKTKEAE